MEYVFEEVDGTAAIVAGAYPGVGAGQSFRALGHLLLLADTAAGSNSGRCA